jgi:hypothetical protein
LLQREISILQEQRNRLLSVLAVETQRIGDAQKNSKMKRGRQETLENDNVFTSRTTTQSSLSSHHYHDEILARAMNFSELFSDHDETETRVLSDCSVSNSKSNRESFRSILHPTNNHASTTNAKFAKEQSMRDDALSAETAPTVATSDDAESISANWSVGTIEKKTPNEKPLSALDVPNSLLAPAVLQSDIFATPHQSPSIQCASTISSRPDDNATSFCTPPLHSRRRDEALSLTAAATQDSIQQAAFAERTADEMAHVVQWWYNSTTNATATMDTLSAPWNTPLRTEGTSSSLDNGTIDSLDQSQSLPCNSLLWDDEDEVNGDEQSVLYSRDSSSMASMPNDQQFGASLTALPSAETLASFDKCIAELWHVTNDAASARYRVDAAATISHSNDTVVTMASGASKSHYSNRSVTLDHSELPLENLVDDVPIRARRERISKQCSLHSAALEELLTLPSTSSASNVQSERLPRRSSHAVDLSSRVENADTNKRLLWQENYALRRRLQSLEGIIAVLCLIVLLLAWQLVTAPHPASLPTSQSTTTTYCSKVDAIIDYTRLSHELRKALAESPSTAQCDHP